LEKRIPEQQCVILIWVGDYEGAKKLLEKAMRSDEQTFGEAHPTIAIRYSNLALVLQDMGDYERAKKLLKKTNTIMQEHFNKDHPYTKKAKAYLENLVQLMNEKSS